ncbi:MAG: four helix bundle protein [Acidobacteria bacterium]|nr:MAG: four helix bundle protein [Acidobacteriota bacterium]
MELYKESDYELPIINQWEKVVHWLLNTTEKFPKRVRFTLSNRIINLSLDFYEDLIHARYSRKKKDILIRGNIKLEQLRLLLRICSEARFYSQKQNEYAMRSIFETGKMLGGWIKTVD